MNYIVTIDWEEKYLSERVVDLSDRTLEDMLYFMVDDILFEELTKEAQYAKPQGVFRDPDKEAEIIFNAARERVERRGQALKIHVTPIKNSNSRISSSRDGLQIIRKILDQRYVSEQLYCDIGPVFIEKLRRFLIQGRWHVGIMKKSSYEKPHFLEIFPEPSINKHLFEKSTSQQHEPAIWFGLKGDEPISCWALHRSSFLMMQQLSLKTPYSRAPYWTDNWKLFWFSFFWGFDWNILFDYGGDHYITWMFAECGMEEPVQEMDLVRRSCPIALNNDDDTNSLLKKISTIVEKNL